MNTHTKIARASAALVAATLIGAAAAAAQPSDAQNGLSAARTGNRGGSVRGLPDGRHADEPRAVPLLPGRRQPGQRAPPTCPQGPR